MKGSRTRRLGTATRGLVTLVLILLVVEWPSPAAVPVFNPDHMAHRTLANGVRIVVREARGSGLVAVQLWVRIGSKWETEETNGISHLLEHLVFRGDRAASPQQVIEEAGGTVNGETDKDATHFDAVLPVEAFEPAVRALAHAIQRNDWTAPELEAAQVVVEQELRGRMVHPIRHANDLAFRAAFRTHPYRWSAGGGTASLPGLGLPQLRRFHAQHYVGAHLILVVVGDVTRARAFAAAQTALGGVKPAESPRTRAFAPEDWRGVRELAVNLPVRLTVLTLAYRAPGLLTPHEVWAMDVLVTLLGEGRRARLRQHLVDTQRLAVDCDAQFQTRREPGLITFTLLVEPGNLARAEQALLEEVRGLAAGQITEEEIARARAQLEGIYAGQNETAEGQAGSLGFYEAIASYETAVRYDALIRAVTAERVRAVAAKYLGTPDYARVLIRGFRLTAVPTRPLP